MPAQQLQLPGTGSFNDCPSTHSHVIKFWGAAQSSMLDPVRCLLSRTSSSCNDESLLEEEVGDEEAQQAEQRNDLHRDAASAGRLRGKAILGSALLSATCHVPLAQARGCLLL